MVPENSGSAEPEDRQAQASKWATICYAVRAWGTTFRLCVICLVIEAPVLAYAILRH